MSQDTPGPDFAAAQTLLVFAHDKSEMQQPLDVQNSCQSFKSFGKAGKVYSPPEYLTEDLGAAEVLDSLKDREIVAPCRLWPGFKIEQKSGSSSSAKTSADAGCPKTDLGPSEKEYEDGLCTPHRHGCSNAVESSRLERGRAMDRIPIRTRRNSSPRKRRGSERQRAEVMECRIGVEHDDRDVEMGFEDEHHDVEMAIAPEDHDIEMGFEEEDCDVEMSFEEGDHDVEMSFGEGGP
ncbi:unnamed protein product [Zymoseptoria tritici ST99CH_1A5]|uniref:Uncharacterized protein n=1 Tax=Zymoseptoria tritici ST99CH_1A5 TaxID=1276529 RepID=A0A1Y6M0N8_ZYMTR|nr:unnamed protein product [Zymoseptoria tritici ST99CH_1A5]